MTVTSSNILGFQQALHRQVVLLHDMAQQRMISQNMDIESRAAV